MSITTIRSNGIIFKESIFHKGQSFTGKVPDMHWGVKICTNGLEPYDLGKDIVLLNTNQLIIFDEKVEYRMYSNSCQSVNGVCLDIHKNFNNNKFIQYILQNKSNIPLDLPNSIVKNITDNTFDTTKKLNYLIDSINSIGTSLKQIENNIYHSFKNKSTVLFNTYVSWKIKLYLEENKEIQFNLSTLSMEIGLSKFKLMRLFKEAFGVTPLTYFHHIKIKHSMSEMKNDPNKSLTTIAQELGYESLSTFTKTFKKYQNIAPSEFKRKLLL